MFFIVSTLIAVIANFIVFTFSRLLSDKAQTILVVIGIVSGVIALTSLFIIPFIQVLYR